MHLQNSPHIILHNPEINLIGLEGEGLKAITEDARIEERNHFEALVLRIYKLGCKLPRDFEYYE